MLEKADQEVRLWAESVADSVALSFSMPNDQPDKPVINLYLVDFEPVPTSGNRMIDLFRVRYLVSTWADNPEQAHALLGQLFQSALEYSKFEVSAEPLPAHFWSAFKIAPRPSFFINYVLTLTKKPAIAPRVTEPPTISNTPAISIHGVLTGPRDIPLAKTRIELPKYKRSSVTDNLGRFNLGAISAATSPLKFLIHIKSLANPLAYDFSKPDGQEILINLHKLEV